MTSSATPPIGPPRPGVAGTQAAGGDGSLRDQILHDAARNHLREDLRGYFAEDARAYSEEAKGFTENVRYQFDMAGKAAGDGIARLGTIALKGLYLTGGKLFEGRDLSELADEFDETVESRFHTSDPDIMDLVYGWQYNRRELEGMTVGQRVDEHIRKRLGNDTILAEAAGVIWSFAAGPGGMLGRATYAGARPMAVAAERALAKRLARGNIEGIAPEIVGQALRSREPLRGLSMLPEWKKQASNYERLLAWGGRHFTDAMATTAALTAQSYAMSPNEERGNAAIMGLMTGPLISPIARVGQMLGGKVMTMGLSDSQKRAVAAVYDDFARGRIPIDQADEMIAAVLPAASRKAMGNTVAAAFEGPAFTWLHGESWKDLDRWLEGDSEAGARLTAQMLGNMVGVAAAKYSVRSDLAPLFRHVRPDLNTVKVAAEAEAVKRSAETEVDAKAWLDKQIQALDAEIGQGEARAKERRAEAEKAGEALPEQAFGDEAGPARVRRQQFSRARQTGEDPVTTKMDADVARYDWADVRASVPMRGGFEAGFPGWDGKTVELRHGGRHTVLLRENGDIVVEKPVAAELERFGRKAEGDVEVVLEDAGLVGMLRAMEGNLAYERMGWREVQPGVWADDANLLYHTMALDGKTNVRNIMGKDLPQRDLAVVGGYGEPDFHHPTLDRFKDMVMAKSAVSSDPLHDGIFNQAILLAEHADSVAARSMRKFFSDVDPAALEKGLTPAGERLLAIQLGSLGAGTNNATNAIAELAFRPPAVEGRGGIAGETMATPPAGVATINIRPDTAAVMLKWAKKRGELGQQLKKLSEGTDKGDIAFDRASYEEFRASWDKFAAKHRETLPEDQREAFIRQEQAVEAKLADLAREFQIESQGPADAAKGYRPQDPTAARQTAAARREALEAAGATPTQPGVSPSAQIAAARRGALERLTAPPEQAPVPLDRQRLGRLQEMFQARGETALAMKLRSLLETGTPEQIREALVEHGEGIVGAGAPVTTKQLKGIAEKAKKAGVKVLDYVITDRAERLGRQMPGDPWVPEFQQARSEQRSIEGETYDLLRDGEKALRKMGRRAYEVVDVDGTPTYRWIALAEGRIQPASAMEAQAARGIEAAGRHLWERAREAGHGRWEQSAEDGRKVEWRRLGKRDKFVMPRQPGSDWQAIFENKPQRLRLFEWLIEKNDITVPQEGTSGRNRPRRRMTPEEMNETWMDKGGTPEISAGERKAAFEFVRQHRHFPSMFEGLQLLRADPFESMRSMIHEQSGRIASARVWGPHVPAEVRPYLEKTEGRKLPPGAEVEMRRFQRRMKDAGIKDAVSKSAEEMLYTLEGGTPTRMVGVLRAMAPLEGLFRSAITTTSFIHDIPAPLAQGPAYAGFRRFAKAIAAVARSPREAWIEAERAGVLLNQMGAHDFREASGKMQKAADLLAILGTKSERGKTVLFDMMAREMLADWKRGRVTGNDRDVLREMLRFDDAMISKLTSGEADAALSRRFRQEFVKMTTGRRTKVEGSEFMANPNVQATVRFGNWISGRVMEIARLNAAVFGKGRTIDQRARAFGRAGWLGSTWAASGVATTLMYYVISDLMKGEDGFERWKKEMAYAPGTVIMRGLQGQVAGGALSSMVRVFGEEGQDAKTWATLTAPSAVAWALVDAYHAQDAASGLGFMRRAGDFFATAARESGAIPTPVRHLFSTAAAAAVGEDPVYRSDARAIRNFERLESIKRPTFVASKTPEFYEALRMAKKALTNTDPSLDAEKRARMAVDAASEHLRTALSLAPEESVAATIRAFQHLEHLPLEDRGKLTEFLDDDAQMTRIVAHDLAVREFASLVGRMHGEEPVEFARELELAEQQARLGDSGVWRRMSDRVLDEAVARVEADEPAGSDIRDFAASAAAFPDQMDWLSERQQRAMMRRGYTSRFRMLQTILRRRVKDRVKDRERERREEQRRGR